MTAFEESLNVLAQLALRHTGATGYVLFDKKVRLAAIGKHIPDAAMFATRGSERIVSFPLDPDGAAAFSFADSEALDQAKPALQRIVSAIQTVWASRDSEARYFRLTRRLSALETELMNSKIADRARGLLNAELAADSVDSLVSHVQNVLRPGPAIHALKEIVRSLEDEIEERRLTGQAKAVLQSAHALSEEQAYTHLRMLSRKSRRRLRDVAADVMAQYTPRARTA